MGGLHWDENFEKLKKYHKENGNFNVPFKYASDKTLGIWVSNQRKRYKRLKKQGHEMDDPLVEQLEAIGFQWSVKPRRSKTVGKVSKVAV